MGRRYEKRTYQEDLIFNYEKRFGYIQRNVTQCTQTENNSAHFNTF